MGCVRRVPAPPLAGAAPRSPAARAAPWPGGGRRGSARPQGAIAAAIAMLLASAIFGPVPG